MRGISVARRLVHGRKLQIGAASFSSLNVRAVGSSAISSISTIQRSFSTKNNNNNSSVSFPFSHQISRNFSSSPSGPSNIVLVGSEEQFNSSLRKVQDESLPAIFYFTAVWCPPCKLLSPIIGQLSEKYPHVTTYKVDIDKEELGSALSRLDINSVPRLHFFQNGKKASEIIGADVQRIKDTMEKLYE